MVAGSCRDALPGACRRWWLWKSHRVTDASRLIAARAPAGGAVGHHRLEMVPGRLIPRQPRVQGKVDALELRQSMPFK